MDSLRGSLVDHHLSEIRKNLALDRAAPTRDERLQKLVDAFSWSDLIAQTRVRFDRTGSPDPRARGLQTGATAELCQEVARDQPGGYDSFHPTIPWAVFAKRDVSEAGSGAYLVEDKVTAVAQILRPWSIVVQGGVTVLPGLRADTSIPKETGSVSGYWLASETATLTESSPTIGSIPMSPKMCGALVDVSRLLRLQGTGLDTYLNGALLKTVGALIDVAVINGSGADGQPQGIIETAGIGATTGGTFALSHVVAARAAIATTNANDAAVIWVGTPAVRALLAARQRFSGATDALWQDDKIDNRSAYVSTAIPTGDLLCGDLSTVTLGIWGAGLQVEIVNNADTTHFVAGITSMRILAGVDVAVTRPAALYVISSIT